MRGFVQRIRKAAHGARALAALLAPPDSAWPVELSRCARPVLLLHGFSSSSRALDVLARRLRRDGFGVFSLSLGRLAGKVGTHGIDDLADLLRARVERLYARNPGMGPMSIVGHSSGGLVGAWYVKRLGGWRRTRAVVTLGTPHHGTPLAWLALPLGTMGRSVWQAMPGSPLLRRLGYGPWPGQVRLASIWSRADRVCRYPAATIETHGLAHLASVEVHASHAGLLTRKAVHAAIVQELRAGELSAPVRCGPLTVMLGGRRPDPRPATPRVDAGTDAA